MRNGKHESNSPSRFIREVDQKYIANPISTESGNSERSETSFSGWGRRSVDNKPTFTSRGSNTYSKPVTSPSPVRRPQVVPKRVDDSEFIPTPILQLKVGQRVEHNRFGYGKILEISGTPADLKAKISFDDHGEKILILKYAKIRAVNVV